MQAMYIISKDLEDGTTVFYSGCNLKLEDIWYDTSVSTKIYMLTKEDEKQIIAKYPEAVSMAIC